MKGLDLRTFKKDLCKVTPRFFKKPVGSIQNIDQKLLPAKKYIDTYFGSEFNFAEDPHKLPFKMFKHFSFDELCKTQYSSVIQMDETVRNLFNTKAEYEIVRKIVSSMWRYGYGSGVWNEVVDAYNNIRHFTFLDNKDFDIKLDYSSYDNDYGYTKITRTYIDGVFAFLVYYKKEHVMTIGFSITKGRGILIQQVQTVKRTGNRFLYKLPKNRIEFTIDLFKRNFPRYSIFVVSGKSLIQKIISGYQKQLDDIYQYNKEKDKKQLAKDERVIEYKRKIGHLKDDEGRLVSFYNNVGSYDGKSEIKVVNRLVYRMVA